MNFCRQTLVWWNFIIRLIFINEASGAWVWDSFLMSHNEFPNLWQQWWIQMWVTQHNISYLVEAFIQSTLHYSEYKYFQLEWPLWELEGTIKNVGQCLFFIRILLICDRRKYETIESIKGLLWWYIKVNLVIIKLAELKLFILYNDVCLTVFPMKNVAAKLQSPLS